MVKRMKPRKEPNSSAVQYRNAIIFWRIHLLIMTVAKRWRQTKQFNVHTSQTILWVNLIRSPLLNFITTSLMMKKQAIIDRRPPVFINMICRNSMKYYDNEYMIYYMIWWTIQRGDMWCQKYSPPIVGAREIRYWRFQGSLLAVKFHPPLFLFLLLVHVNVVLVVSFFNTLRRWAIDTKSYFCSYSNNSTIYRHINPYQSLPTLGKTTHYRSSLMMMNQTVFCEQQSHVFEHSVSILKSRDKEQSLRLTVSVP